MGGLDGMQLVYFIVSFVLRYLFSWADSTSLDKSIEHYQIDIAYHKKQLDEGEGNYEENISSIEYSRNLIDELPNRVKRNYELYTYLCENLIERLFEEQYLLFEYFKPKTEEEDKYYNFTLQWFMSQAEQEQSNATKSPTSSIKKMGKTHKTDQ